VDIRKRGRVVDQKLDLLRGLLAGEVNHDGRRINVTPPPHTVGGPMLMWGGGTIAAARRAGRYGLGMLGNANVAGMQEAYEAACREHGHEPGPVYLPDRDTPSVCFVADDVDQAWGGLGLYLLHDARSYVEWNPDNDTSAGISHVDTVDELRALSRSHRIYSVSEAVERMRAGEVINLSPVCGGLPPELAWPYLKRVGEVVMSEAARLESPVKSHFRMARTSTTVGDVKIPAGTTVMLLPGASNRDARKFEEPNEFRVDRANVREHIAFERGNHSCPGAPLARAEGRISLNRILDRMTDIRVNDAAHGSPDARQYTYEPTWQMRGLTELHLEFAPVR
jgi:Cytochrome P450/Luciferase-like monooxygenase